MTIARLHFGSAQRDATGGVRIIPATGGTSGRGEGDNAPFTWARSGVAASDFIPSSGLITLDGGVAITEWTPSEHADAAGVVYEATLTAVAGALSYYSGAWTFWEDGAWPTRYATVADVAAHPGSFYVVTVMGSHTTIYVHPYNSTDPRSDGKLYEYGRYPLAFDFTNVDGATFHGPVHLTRYCSGYGNISGGKNFYSTRVLTSRGGKHNAVLGSGLIEDWVSYDGENSRVAPLDGGPIPYTWYTPDSTGLSWEMRRCIGVRPADRPRMPGGFIYSHSGVPVDDYYASGRVDAFCAVRGQIGGTGNITATADIVNSYVQHVGQCVDVPKAALCTLNLNLFNVIGAINYGAIIHGPSSLYVSSACEIADNCVYQGVYTGSGLVYGVETHQAQTLNIHHNTIAVRDTALNSAVYCETLADGSRVRNNIIVIGAGAKRFVYIPNNCDCDYNVYVQLGTGGFWQDFTTGSASWADWRTESGHDINSVLLNSAQADELFLNGVAGMADGDFRLNPAYAGTFVDGTPIVANAGCSQYYDYNARVVRSGQPSRWPVPPDLESECEAYVINPTSWNFYP